jgi:hypothetical protein
MVTKATIVASRIEFIEVALLKLGRELENAEGSQKVVLQKSIAEAQQTLRRLERLNCHNPSARTD